jgi:hypothetical protein
VLGLESSPRGDGVRFSLICKEKGALPARTTFGVMDRRFNFSV